MLTVSEALFTSGVTYVDFYFLVQDTPSSIGGDGEASIDKAGIFGETCVSHLQDLSRWSDIGTSNSLSEDSINNFSYQLILDTATFPVDF